MLRLCTALLIATISTLSAGTQLSSHSATAADAVVEAELHSGSGVDMRRMTPQQEACVKKCFGNGPSKGAMECMNRCIIN